MAKTFRAPMWRQWAVRLAIYLNAALSVLPVFVVGNDATTHAMELEGFTEPHRTIHVAADETGIIAELLVQEGELVQSGQTLARLNSDVHTAQLAIAEQNMKSAGRLDAATAEVHLRRERLEKLQALRPEGHARQEEVDRAEMEWTVAEANLRAASEELLTRKLEYEKIRVQLDRRTVHSPVAAVVSVLHKQVGEFVAPNDPDILTLVELNPLLANFTVQSTDADKLRMGQEMDVTFLGSGVRAKGAIEFVAPITDAESGAVQIKLRIDNGDGRFRSGERCKIRLGSD